MSVTRSSRYQFTSQGPHTSLFALSPVPSTLGEGVGHVSEAFSHVVAVRRSARVARTLFAPILGTVFVILSLFGLRDNKTEHFTS